MRTRLNTTKLYLISASSIRAFASFFLCQVSAALPWVYPRAEVTCFVEWVGGCACDRRLPFVCFFFGGSTSIHIKQDLASLSRTREAMTRPRNSLRQIAAASESVGGPSAREPRAKIERWIVSGCVIAKIRIRWKGWLGRDSLPRIARVSESIWGEDLTPGAVNHKRKLRENLGLFVSRCMISITRIRLPWSTKIRLSKFHEHHWGIYLGRCF